MDRAGRRSLLATLLFFAFTAPFGIVAHLVSELAGLGWHDDADVAFSARHAYLAVIAIAAAALFAGVLRALPAGDRRRRIAEIVDRLPFRGHGPGFIALSFLVQFGFFAVTQIGEGCPLCSGDLFTGIMAAAAAALIGALIVSFGKRRVIELALWLVWYRAAIPWAQPFHPKSRRGRRATGASSGRRAPFSFRYRPPPAAAASPTA